MKLLPVILFFLVFNLNAQNTLPNCNGLYLCDDELIKFARDFLAFPPSDCKLWDGSCGYDGEISRTGKVTIGTPLWLLSDYKLGVQGGIITEQLKICNNIWCDYVFEDTFKLKPLPEVDGYIRKNGHLPGCVPAAVIENGEGIAIERETVSQQKKIEEIYLHLFALDQRLNTMTKPLLVPAENFQAATSKTISDSGVQTDTVTNLVQNEHVILVVNCFQISRATMDQPNGKIGVIVTGAAGSVTVTCSKQGNVVQTINNSSCTETIIFSGLTEGFYIITVQDATGNSETCSVQLNFWAEPWASNHCGIINDEVCRTDIINYVREGINSNNCDQWDGSSCSEGGRIFRAGNVCIGTDQSQGGFSLAVKGGIITNNFKIELCETEGWCDYVFDEHYDLMPLKQVSEFTRTNKHLPGMITQTEILENGGYEVKTVKMEQQVKIEEAFLYLIQLEEKKQQIQKQLSEL